MPFTPKFVDLVRNYSTSTGTGNFALGAAVPGHASLAGSVAVGERFFYCILGIDKPTEREVGRGTMAANGTIAREAISGELTNFTPGNKSIALVAAAEWFRNLGQMVNGGGDTLDALATTNKTSLIAAVNEVAAAAAAGGGGGGGAPSVLFVAAGGSAVAASVKAIDSAGYAVAGSGIARYIYDAAVNAAFVTANPRTAFLAADGRGFRLDPHQRLSIEMFGGRAEYVSNANRGTDNLAAMLAAATFKPDATRNFSPTVHFGIGSYYVSATFEPRFVFHFKGHGKGFGGGGVIGYFETRLIWPTDVRCISLQAGNTVGETSGSGLASDGSSIDGFGIEQITLGTNLSAHGIRARTTPVIQNCEFANIAGDAIRISASAGYGGALEGNANDWRIEYCDVNNCGGDGLHVSGQDANGGTCIHFTTHQGVQGCGVRDIAVLPNVYIGLQLTGYGDSGVFHLGRRYQLVAQDETLGATTTPGTNANVWYDLGANVLHVQFPQWVSGTAYRMRLPFFSGQSPTIISPYHEQGSTIAHAPGALVVGGNLARTQFTSGLNIMTGGGVTCNTGVGHYRSTGGDANQAAHAFIGEREYTLLGQPGPDLADLHKRARIFSHSVTDVAHDWMWRYENVVGGIERDIVSRYANVIQWSISGKGTARTYGRSAPVEGVFTLHDAALGDATNPNNSRIMGMREAAPTTGNHARGEFLFNVNPSASGTLGWSCTTGGSPGSWTVVPVAGFSGDYAGDATFGNLTIGTGVDGRKLRVENSSGFGLMASMNSATSTLYIDNVKPGTGFSDMNLRANSLALWGGSTSAPVQTLVIGPAGVDVIGKMAATGAVTSNSPDAGVGYRAGAGGAVTQATSKATGVSLNRVAGQITLSSASLAAGASVSFTLTDSTIAASDVVVVGIAPGASADGYEIAVTAVAAGSCRIRLRNVSAGALAEAVVVNFAVIKAVAA